MYRTNYNHGVPPRDRLDPRLIEKYAHHGHSGQIGRKDCACDIPNCSITESNRDTNSCETYPAEFNYTLAMVYPPEQVWQNIYCVEEGFMAGTIFRELDKPFYGPKCHGGNG